MTEKTTVWVLEREDGLCKTSDQVHWIEFDDSERGVAAHKNPGIGRSCLLGQIGPFFTWQTTVVTDILEESENLVKFTTKNSAYTLRQIEIETWKKEQE